MTPIRINLLPHRQLRRAQRQRLFVVLAVIVAGLGLAAIAIGQIQLVNAKNAQDRRNTFLQTEITKLDKQIAEIKQLRDKTQDLLSRKNVVEALQGNRAEAVRLFDELARRMPDGLYLKSVKQSGDSIALSGYAQSSARVSTYMRALDETPLFQDPVLVEVKAAQVGNLRVNEFSMNVKITHLALQAAAKGGKP
ncbi:MAG: PilN domain-containing protein [Gammaproteobacteria bacterium]|nr:PilN domain-containing protein [Gammaproteobacteria bacterium]